MDPANLSEGSGLLEVNFRLPSSVSDSVLWVPDSRQADSVSNESGVSVETEPTQDGINASSERGSWPDDDVCVEQPSMILEETREQTIKNLRAQLTEAEEELKNKNEKCVKLEQLQDTVDKEIQELTASLFQEAYKMVTTANEKRVHAEKLLKEANGKIEVLQAEVDALKILVLNNTPSSKTSKNKSFASPASKSGNNSPRKPGALGGSSPAVPKSKFSIIHRRNNSDTPSTSVQSPESDEEISRRQQLEFREVDPILHKEFTQWREKQDLLDKKNAFLKRVYQEEIMPCIDFEATQLAERVLTAVEKNTIEMEQVNEEKPKTKTCALSLVPRICPFRLKTDDDCEWIYISQLCRNRIAAVCDFFTYLRYLQVGLVKTGLHDAYWETVRLRKNMSLARLGLGFLPAAGRKEHRNS